jgi:hypothetical protein
MSTTGASDDEHIAAGNAASSRVAGYELPLTLNTSADNETRSLWAAAAKSHLKAESVSFGNKSIDSLSD